MIVLLGVLSALLPLLIGSGLLSVFYGRVKTYRITMSESYLLGMICLIGLMEIVHAMCWWKNVSLKETGTIFAGVLIVTAFAASAAAVIRVIRSGKKETSATVKEQTGRVLPMIFGLLLLCQILLILSKENIVTPGDITLETVQSFLAQDGIYQVMPLTGLPSEQGMPLRYTILCLPTLYAVLCQMFSIEPEYLVTKIIPAVVLCAAYFAYYRLSAALFGEEQKKDRFLFLIIVACVFLFSDRAAYLDGYSALHSGYLGTSIRNLVLIPYTFSAVLEKRWWKAVLCILAEACITWTFWGCGICLLLTLGMVLLTIVDHKCPFLHQFIQFFHKKEELS